jgi:hypothetical protein
MHGKIHRQRCDEMAKRLRAGAQVPVPRGRTAGPTGDGDRSSQCWNSLTASALRLFQRIPLLA